MHPRPSTWQHILSITHTTRLHPSLNILSFLIQVRETRLRLPRLGRSWQPHLLDLLETLACGFRVGEVCLSCGAEAEDPEDDEDFVGDVLETGRDEEADGEIEEPVADGGDGHAV